jgi:hypothetical protein
MHIVALKSAHKGFIGIMDDGQAYIYFKLAREVLKHLQVFPKADFIDHAHFVEVMQRFISPACFFPRPKAIDTISTQSLQRLVRP